MRAIIFTACMALALSSSPSFAQTAPMSGMDHDHGQVQPAPTRSAPPPDTHSEHDHGTTAGGSMGGMGMGGGMQGMGEMPMMEPTAANPFPHVEMKMHMAMIHATGADAMETYVRKMIEYHRGAVEMSRLILGSKLNRTVSRMATQSIADQSREIDALQAWLRQNGKTAQ